MRWLLRCALFYPGHETTGQPAPNSPKLLRTRRDGTLGPLFINRRLVITLNRWLAAEDHPTPGYARRPGWHVLKRRHAPHLSLRDRVWCRVEISGWVKVQRPANQGGAWWLAERMRVLRVCPGLS